MYILLGMKKRKNNIIYKWLDFYYEYVSYIVIGQVRLELTVTIVILFTVKLLNQLGKLPNYFVEVSLSSIYWRREERHNLLWRDEKGGGN